MISILTQAPVYVEQDVHNRLQQYDKQAHIHVDKIIFYPYYFFEFSLSAQSLLGLKGKVACTIDALSGNGALIDMQPKFSSYDVDKDQTLPIDVNEEEAKQLAEKFLFQTTSSTTKFVTVPEMEMVHGSLFYRPFWLAEYGLKELRKQLTVDAISGSYHPL